MRSNCSASRPLSSPASTARSATLVPTASSSAISMFNSMVDELRSEAFDWLTMSDRRHATMNLARNKDSAITITGIHCQRYQFSEGASPTAASVTWYHTLNDSPTKSPEQFTVSNTTSLPKVIWEEGRVAGLSHTYAPIGYNGAPQICPQKYPFPRTDCQTSLPASSLDPSELWCQTASGSDPPFFHNALQRDTQTHRPTERSRESSITIGRSAQRPTRPNNTQPAAQVQNSGPNHGPLAANARPEMQDLKIQDWSQGQHSIACQSTLYWSCIFRSCIFSRLQTASASVSASTENSKTTDGTSQDSNDNEMQSP